MLIQGLQPPYQIARADNALIFVGLRPGITVARPHGPGDWLKQLDEPVKQVVQAMWIPAYPVIEGRMNTA